jgi:hypothetical protein
MANKILFAPRQSQEVLDIVRSLTPHGFELVVADFGTPEFYQVAADAEYFTTLTPHSAGPTWENWTSRFRNGFDNIQRVAAGGQPRWVIPELA